MSDELPTSERVATSRRPPGPGQYVESGVAIGLAYVAYGWLMHPEVTTVWLSSSLVAIAVAAALVLYATQSIGLLGRGRILVRWLAASAAGGAVGVLFGLVLPPDERLASLAEVLAMFGICAGGVFSIGAWVNQHELLPPPPGHTWKHELRDWIVLATIVIVVFGLLLRA